MHSEEIKEEEVEEDLGIADAETQKIGPMFAVRSEQKLEVIREGEGRGMYYIYIYIYIGENESICDEATNIGEEPIRSSLIGYLI